LKKVLIITHNQFGYQVSSYQYAIYLGKFYNVKYLCFDYGRKRIEEDNIDIVYVSKHGNKLKQYFRFMKKIKDESKNKPDIIILKYFPFCFLINRFFNTKIILDIRTGSVSNSELKNLVFNKLICLESKLFRYIIILSERLRKYLNIKNQNCFIVPLGADVISKIDKSFAEFRLLYVGTLRNRNIHKTIYAFNNLMNKDIDINKISYSIIGFGSDDDIKKIKQTIIHFKIQDKVKFLGLVPYNELSPFFDSHNIGICYIPVTKYYNFQPSTKTYEFLLSGMPVLATRTFENCRIINDINGILVKDDIENITQGLYELYLKRNQFNSKEIRNTVKGYTWSNIMENKFIPYIEKIINEK